MKTCNSTYHETVAHPDSEPQKTHEGERVKVCTSCTKVCGTPHNTSKSCVKIVLIRVFWKDNRTVYAVCIALLMIIVINHWLRHILSMRSGIRVQRLNMYWQHAQEKSVSSGRLLSEYAVQSLDGSYTRTLPSLLECNEMPNK